MKKFFLFAVTAVLLTSCTSSLTEGTTTTSDSTTVCIDTCKAAPTTTLVMDTVVTK